jgi:hypothetical protein
MKTVDILLSIFIIILFFILYFVNVLAIDTKDIQNNWPKYRCNPSIMPLASILGPNGTNASDNFVYCVQNMQKNYMEHLLQPVNYNIDVLSQNMNETTNSMISTKNFISGLRDKLGGINGIIPNVFGVFSNLIIEVQRNTINIKDTFSKIIGVIASFIFILDGSVKTSSSLWAGPPGSMIRAISKIKIPKAPKCFHPDTLIKKENGEIVKIKNIKLGDILINNSVVLATLKINNLDNNNNIIKKFYKFENSGEINNKGYKDNIYVTGCHLVFDVKSYNFLMVKNHNKSLKTTLTTDYFICLITTNHIITIGDYIFHDWEDNNGSKSK